MHRQLRRIRSLPGLLPLVPLSSDPNHQYGEYNCPKPNCAMEFPEKRDLARHIRTSHRYTVRSHVCPETGCTKSFASISNMNRHFRTHEQIRRTSSRRNAQAAVLVELEPLMRCSQSRRRNICVECRSALGRFGQKKITLKGTDQYLDDVVTNFFSDMKNFDAYIDNLLQ